MKKLPQFLPLIVISSFLILTNIVFLWIVLSKKSVPRPKIPTRATEGPAYLTILAGRSPWQAGLGCSPFRALPNSVPLDRVALEMKTISSDLKAYGTIIETYTREGTDRFCKNGNSYPTWNDLTNLKNNYGWVFGTNGKTHRTKAQLSTEEAQRDESVGALTQLQSHGHDKAWALFAYPNADEVVRTDPVYSSMQTNIVSADFAYGREYVYTPDSSAKNRRSEIGPPWWQKTYNTFGGKCNNSSLSCYNLRVFGNDRRYTKPSDLINFVNVQSDEWASLQFHFFVEGRNGDQTRDNSWDCTSPDRNKHWTTSPELYCWNDFKYVLGTIPSNVQVVTPDVVATAWGRTPPFNVTPTPSPTPTSTPTPTPTATPTPTPTPEESILKEPMRGAIPRDGMAVEAYREVANGFVVNVRWSELQADPPDSPIIHPNPIDNTLAQIRAWNSTHDPDLSLKIRLFTTTTTPTFWSANREVVGEPILIRNPATGRSGYIGRFWTSSYKQAYDSLQTKLAEEYDDEIEIKDVTISRCMLVFAEPFLRYQTSTLRSSGWNEILDSSCHREAIDAHRVWTTTRSSLALNPEGPWREMIDYCRLSLGQRCILENNSLRSTSQGASYENMYSLIQAKGPPIIFQTATSDKIGSWQTTLQKAIGYGANALELNSGYTSYDLNELRDFDLQLEANPIGD